MLIMGSANEGELIFWNKEDRQWVPVQGDPRRQGCYVLVMADIECIADNIPCSACPTSVSPFLEDFYKYYGLSKGGKFTFS